MRNVGRRRRVFPVIAGTLIAVCCVVLCVCVYLSDRDESRDRDAVTQVMSQVVTDVSQSVGDGMDDDAIDGSLLRRVDFGYLQGVNPDVESWLHVPDTNIDEVVVREPVVNRYKYDLRDWTGARNSSGTYLFPAEPRDSEGNVAKDVHQLLLGHRMISYRGQKDWKFSHLPTRWATKAGAESHPYVYLYYGDHSERWRVWCAGDVWSSDMVYDQPYEVGSKEYQGLIDHMKGFARYENGDAPDVNTKTLVLSTCDRPDGGVLRRFVLVCVPDAAYYYDSMSYVDLADKAKYEAWQRGINDNLSSAIKALDEKAVEAAKKELSEKADLGVIRSENGE